MKQGFSITQVKFVLLRSKGVIRDVQLIKVLQCTQALSQLAPFGPSSRANGPLAGTGLLGSP